MNIAYVCADPGVPVFGKKGASIHVREVIHALTQLGHNVMLYARSMGGEAPAGFEHVRVVALEVAPKSDDASREVWLMQSNATTRAKILEQAHVDMIYERHSLWSDAPMSLARELGVPGILEVNAPLVREQATHRTLHHALDAVACARRSFQGASGVVAVSEEVAEYVRSEGAGNVHVVANGVDIQRFHPEITPAAISVPDDDSVVVGFVGTLKPWHGVEVLLEAFAQLAGEDVDIKLLIVGDGPLLASLKSRAQELNLASRVVFTGAVQSTDVPAYVCAMDIAVAPYPQTADCYFSPLKLFEYMACGRAIVASRTGQITDVLEDGVNGLLCEPGVVNSLCDTIRRVVVDVPLRSTLGRAARVQAEQRHSWMNVAKRIVSIAEQVQGASACVS